MEATVPIALFGWPLFVLVLFGAVQPRIAALVGILGGWLFLPMVGYEFSGLPTYSKMSAAAYGVILGILIFDIRRVQGLRLRWFDLPVLLWCVSPLASSVSNGLGVYDGLSGVFGQILLWGVPYVVGRLYFTDLEGLRVLATGIVIGGLLYVPLCLVEVRMSPRLHIWIYGSHQHSWVQTRSFGGWRPTVFMQHGIAVGMWMTTVSLFAVWMWWTGAIRRIAAIPMSYVAVIIPVTAVLCKSTGALALLAMGGTALIAIRLFRSTFVVWILVLAPLLYMGVRAPGLWDGAGLLDAVEFVVPDKEASLRYRMDAEDVLAAHAMRQPWFGWAGHSRNRPWEMGEESKALATDGMWIITFGQRGVVGLAAFAGVILFPAMLALWRLRRGDWSHPATAPLGAFVIVLALFMIDCLFNAMMNPIYAVIAGGVTAALASRGRQMSSVTTTSLQRQPIEAGRVE